MHSSEMKAFVQRHQDEWFWATGTLPTTMMRSNMDVDLVVGGCPCSWITYWKAAPCVSKLADFEMWQHQNVRLHAEILSYLLAERRMEIRLKLFNRIIETFPITKSQYPMRLLAESYFTWQQHASGGFALCIGVSRDKEEELALMVEADKAVPFLQDIHSGEIVYRYNASLLTFLQEVPLIVGWLR